MAVGTAVTNLMLSTSRQNSLAGCAPPFGHRGGDIFVVFGGESVPLALTGVKLEFTSFASALVLVPIVASRSGCKTLRVVHFIVVANLCCAETDTPLSAEALRMCKYAIPQPHPGLRRSCYHTANRRPVHTRRTGAAFFRLMCVLVWSLFE